MSCSVNHETMTTKFCPVCGNSAAEAQPISLQPEQQLTQERQWPRGNNRDLTQGRKINKLLIIPLALFILGGGAGSFYYIGVQSDKATFAEECRVTLPKITEKFRELEGTSYKPGPFGVVKPSVTALELRGLVTNLKISAEDNSLYSGARKTLDSIEIFNQSFSKFQTIQNKKFRIEISNPHTSILQAAWNMYANRLSINIFNDLWQKSMKRVLLEYESKWDSHVSRNYSRADQIELNDAAELVNTEITAIADICRSAKA